MRALVIQLMDRFIPADIKAFEQDEEIIRARALVFILLGNVIAGALFLLLTFVGDIMSAELRLVAPYTLTALALGCSISLWIFFQSGLFAVSGNLYALVMVAISLATAIQVEDQAHIILILLAIPVIVSLVANHVSAVVWLLVVAMVPQLVSAYRLEPLSVFFVNGWLACCFMLFFALFMENYYRENMRERLNAERTQFEFAAAHDPLTGLANRATFDRRLQECIEHCALHDTRAVLLYIDLDEFKPINDTYGHQAGDIVLTVVARRLRSLVRRSDTVARLGGDEFAILLESCTPQDIESLTERLAVEIRKPIEVFDNQLTVGCSVGMVLCPDDGQHPDQLAHKADERMYAEKRQREG